MNRCSPHPAICQREAGHDGNCVGVLQGMRTVNGVVQAHSPGSVQHTGSRRRPRVLHVRRTRGHANAVYRCPCGAEILCRVRSVYDETQWVTAIPGDRVIGPVRATHEEDDVPVHCDAGTPRLVRLDPA